MALKCLHRQAKPPPCHTRKWSNLATNRHQQDTAVPNSIGQLMPATRLKAEFFDSKLPLPRKHPRGVLWRRNGAGLSIHSRVVIAMLPPHCSDANLAVANLRVENAMAPRYQIPGGPWTLAVGLLLSYLSPEVCRAEEYFFSCCSSPLPS